MKINSGLLIGSAAVLGSGWYLKQLYDTGQTLETVTKPGIESFSARDISLKVAVIMINKGNASLRLSNIKVKIEYQTAGGKRIEMLKSRPLSTPVVVPAKKSSSFTIVLDSAKIDALASAIGQDNYKRFLTTGIPIVQSTSATVNFALPYEKEEVQTMSLASLKLNAF